MKRRSGISAIEFVCPDRDSTTDCLRVQIVIDGQSLEKRWNSQGTWNVSAPLWTGPDDEITPLDLWSSSFDPSAYGGELVSEDGRVAVLTCDCGELMCGGVVARIEFNDDTVTWCDFAHANYLTPQVLDSFVFSRAQYDQALAEAHRAHDHG